MFFVLPNLTRAHLIERIDLNANAIYKNSNGAKFPAKLLAHR